jgi:excisionase family DNA binding protein
MADDARSDRPRGSLECMAIQSAPELPFLLTMGEVARRANVSLSTVKREIERGRLRALHVGRQVRIDSGDFRRWLEGGPE